MQNGKPVLNPSTPPHWYIIGAGAQGCLWGAYLMKAGLSVSFIVRRKEQQQTLQQQGLQLSNSQGIHEPPSPVDVILSDEIPLKEPFIQQCLIATKAYQSFAAAQSLQPYLHEHASVVLLQNGMGIQQSITELLPQKSLYALVSSEGALLKHDGHVAHTGLGKNQLGLLNEQQHLNNRPQGPDTIFWQLHSTLLNLEWQPDIQAALIKKLAVNCAINALTACLDCNNGDLGKEPNLTQFQVLCSEIQLVISELCKQHQVADIHVYEQALHVVKSTAKNSSSMREDVRHQRATEIHAINGYLLKQAQSMNINCPLNDSLMQQVLNLTPHK